MTTRTQLIATMPYATMQFDHRNRNL